MASGHLEKRYNKSWTIVLDLGRDENGKRKRVAKSFRGTKREAEKELTRLLAEAEQGIFVLPTNNTVADFLKAWLDKYARPNLARTTVEGYDIAINKHLIPELGTVPLEKLTPLQIQSYCAKKLKEVSPRTVQLHYTVLREALGHAVKWQLLARNPADAVDRPKYKRPNIDSLNVQELHKFLDYVQRSHHQDHNLIFIAVYTGMRLGELLALRWEDVDLEQGRIFVRRAAHYTGKEGLDIGIPKTEKSRRQIILPPTAVKALKQQKEAVERAKKLQPELYEDNDLVFPTIDGKMQNPKNVSHRFSALAKKTGFPGLTFHGLRHTHASLLLAEGVHPKVVQERLGHSTISITLDTYSHTVPTLQEEAAEKLENLLSETKGQRLGNG